MTDGGEDGGVEIMICIMDHIDPAIPFVLGHHTQIIHWGGQRWMSLCSRDGKCHGSLVILLQPGRILDVAFMPALWRNAHYVLRAFLTFPSNLWHKMLRWKACSKLLYWVQTEKHNLYSSREYLEIRSFPTEYTSLNFKLITSTQEDWD